jgi:pimeloyl-ACP methyl ester carboxylesterase
VLLLLADGTQVPVTELPGSGPWTFLVLRPGGPDPLAADAAELLTRFGRVVVPDLRGRPGWGAAPGSPGFLDLVDDLDQVRTRAGIGRPVLVGVGDLVPAALRAAADQPWAWRALLLAPWADRPVPAADVDRLDVPVLVVERAAGPGEAAAPSTGEAPAPDRGWDDPGVVEAVEGLLGQLGGGPGWAGIAPDAPPR